jgi:hypothetical protein
LSKGFKKFHKRNREAAKKEVHQIQQRNCFIPIDALELTEQEKKLWKNLSY